MSDIRQKTPAWLTPVNLHWTGVAVVVAINLYLVVAMFVLWQKEKSANADALAQQRMSLKAAQIAALPLDGLDSKLRLANEGANTFYEDRLPVSYSQVATELGVLKDRDHVRLTGVNYAQKPVANVPNGSAGQLTEVTMDARLSGEYRGLVEFLNGMERSRLFLVINGVTLTGQETGRVNLRVKMTTYLRGLSSDEEAARFSSPVVVVEAKTPAGDAQ